MWGHQCGTKIHENFGWNLATGCQPDICFWIGC